MPHTIFFSWQADTPEKVGKTFIGRVLERVLGHLATDAELEEPIREGLELDQDTKGMPGSPPIVDSIFLKIDKAAVFVPDLTFVGTRRDGRPTPNPNVLIEYGWALKSLSYSRIVPVMNTAYGEPTAEALPFDMRHLRHPICYHLPETADEETRKAEREKLMKELDRAIRTVLASEEFKASLPRPPEFVPAEPKDGPSCFLAPGESLATFEDVFQRTTRVVNLQRGPHVYLRVMPTHDAGRWNPLELKKAATEPQPLLVPMGQEMGGMDWGKNRHGFVITSGGVRQTGEAASIVQVFHSGEVWAIDASPFWEHEGRRIVHCDFEKALTGALKRYRDFLAKALGVRPPFRWIAGMTGLEDRQIVLPPARPGYTRFNPIAGRCSVDALKGEGTIGLDDDPADILRPFFDDVWGHFGLDRAQVYGG